MAFSVPIKYIVLTNWFLAVWGVFTSELGLTYLFANLTMTAFGIWCMVDKHTMEGFTAYGASYLFALISDFMTIGVWAPKYEIAKHGDSNQKFMLASACLGLIAKFLFLFFLWQEYNTRGSANVEGSSHAPLQGQAYDPIPHAQRGGAQQTGAYDPLHAADPLAQQQQQQQFAAQNAAPQMQGVVPPAGVAGGYQQGPQSGYTGM